MSRSARAAAGPPEMREFIRSLSGFSKGSGTLRTPAAGSKVSRPGGPLRPNDGAAFVGGSPARRRRKGSPELTATSPPPSPRDAYTELLTRHGALRDGAAKRSLRLSNVRGVTFLAAAAAWITVDAAGGALARGALALAVVLTAVFVWQVIVHRRVRRVERWEAALADLAQEGLLRIDRDWDGLEEKLPPAERVAEQTPVDHPYGLDLGILGHASLTRLAGPVTSERGTALLRTWLLSPGTVAEAEARHGALRELAPRVELRTSYAALGRLKGPERLEGLERFLAWAEGEPWALSRRWLRASAFVLPPLLVVGLVGYFALGWLPWWILPAAAHVVVLRRIGPHAKESFAESVQGGAPLRALVPQIDLLGREGWHDPLLASIARRLGEGAGSAHGHLERLSRLLDSVESRRNAFYAMVAPILLLDVHLSVALDRWRAEHGLSTRPWLEALGEWEALSALATLAYDHPDWAYPTLAADTEAPTELSATALGHPLLPPDACVRNDVSIGPPGSFLFVTGSNMSGKSTLLRAIGANAVLAAAGAPVCARALRLPALRVHTSMRVEDSLEEGVSLFMAELLRIKEVVDAASAANAAGPRVLYLLDEILHGTNTAERRIAARGVVRHLLATGAIGAVSSHDLTLVDVPDLRAAAHAVHFREEVEGDRLSFDYTLREGVATTRNALKLLDAVGLGGLTAGQDEDV
jgi:hypothetical protein